MYQVVETGVNSIAYTYGSGGRRARNGGRGSTGGTSSFGSYCTATGGAGGQSDSPYEGGHGGTATGGDINIPGGGGEMSHDHNREGGGGSSFWHKAGSNHHCCGGTYNITAGQWGSGGGWGYYSQNAENSSDGGAGCVIVYVILKNMANFSLVESAHNGANGVVLELLMMNQKRWKYIPTINGLQALRLGIVHRVLLIMNMTLQHQKEVRSQQNQTSHQIIVFSGEKKDIILSQIS